LDELRGLVSLEGYRMDRLKSSEDSCVKMNRTDLLRNFRFD